MPLASMTGLLRRKFTELSSRNSLPVGRVEIAIILTFYALLLAIKPMEPADDLLRHMKAYTYGFDYRVLWPFSPGVPHFDPYLLFDIVAGFIHRTCGANGYHILQTAALCLYFGAIYALCKEAPDRNWRVLLSLIITALLIERITLARPSIFASGLFLLAVAACKEQSIRWYWHLALSLCMASFYFLFFIYLIPLVLYRREYLAGIVLGLAGWTAYAGGEYFHFLRDVIVMDTMRSGMTVSEGSSLLVNMLRFLWVLIPLALYFRKDLKQLLLVAWFFLSNQLRYIETVLPLLASYAQHLPWRITQASLVFILFPLFLYTLKPTSGDDSFRVLAGAVPAGSSVMCLESSTMYKLVYGNDHLRLSPSLDVALDTAEYRDTMKTSSRKGILSGDLSVYDFLVEKNLKEPPADMALYKLAGKYRVWRKV